MSSTDRQSTEPKFIYELDFFGPILLHLPFYINWTVGSDIGLTLEFLNDNDIGMPYAKISKAA